MKRLIPAALLLIATGALADSPMPGAEVPMQEIVTRTPAETPKADEQLGTLTREVQSLETDVQQLQTEQGLHAVQYLDQNEHALWP